MSTEEVGEFIADIVNATHDAAEPSVHTNLHRSIAEWRATARILAAPDLTARLTITLPYEDHGEVPAP